MALSAVVLIGSTPAVLSFVPGTKQSSATRGACEALFLSPDELTNYMAKAHEEKLRAVKVVEQKKDAQIQTLKVEVNALKAQVPKESAVVLSSQPATGMDLSSMTTEELRAKLVQYQSFMAKYIVQAQQQKLRAVQAAELATAAKYEAKIKLLLAGSSNSSTTEAPTADVVSSPASTEKKLHDARNANVAAAAKAGKSRWGEKEVAKASVKEVAKVKITKDPVVDVKSEANTDKVNGATKANGAAPTESVPSPIALPGSPAFDQRNKKVAAAGKAGKSRWGDAEVKKATAEAAKSSLPSTPASPSPPSPASAVPLVVSAEIEAADHGLRNDGGVGGPSLAERVNLGQRLFSTDAITTTHQAPIVEVKPQSVYDLRNARIASAAAAGKSRWGSMENSKAATLSSSMTLTDSTTAVSSAVAQKSEAVLTPEIEAADHGLRNDGGVGGPSLAERINLGAGLLKD